MQSTTTRLLALTATFALALISTPLPAQAPATEPLTITGLISAADTNAEKQVTIEGMATWVCPHMGCKAQLVNADGASKTTLLVTQGKGMPKFSPELKGDTLRITGILHEKRTTAADLDEQEAAIKNPSAAETHAAGHDHAKGGDDCANCPDKQKQVSPEQAAKVREAQLARIAKHRELLAKSQKGYLVSYTFEGKSWTKID